MPEHKKLMSDKSAPPESSLGTLSCQAAALIVFLAILWAPTPEGLAPVGQRVAAVTALMAVLWLTQSIPIAATSLIPLVAFPCLGIQTADDVSNSYINANVFLFLGGFIVALGIERWGLHRRLALHIVRLLGSSPKRVVLGFMLASAFLSMWISNTASALLMMPIGLATMASLGELAGESSDSKSISPAAFTGQTHPAIAKLGVVLMLGIAYSCSIGGFTTLVGTPTNVQFQQIWRDQFPQAEQLSAGQWMFAFVPLGAIFLLVAWGTLCFRLPRIPGAEKFNRGFFSQRLRALGPPRRAEILMLLIFATTALLWIFRVPLQIGEEPLTPGWGEWAQRFLIAIGTDEQIAARAMHDSTVAMGMALLMFFIPGDRDANGQTRYLMDWQTAERLPWGILLLIGGGFALAAAFSDTGLSAWVGQWFAAGVEGWPTWLIVLAVCLMLTFLTEFTSNVATISAILPILAGASLSLGLDPRLIMFPAAISTSCAFMLPIATPPNAIIFGSGKVQIGDMVRYGVVLNLIGVLLITALTFFSLVPQLGISLKTLPDWAVPADAP